MIDDVIANVYDKDGRKIEITMKDCYKTSLDVVTLLYHDYMVRIIDGDFYTFRQMHVNTTERMLDMIHSRYADHVEGIRMEFLERSKLIDPRRDQSDG